MSEVRAVAILFRDARVRRSHTPAEAQKELESYQDALFKNGLSQFPEYAKQRSDCSSYRNGGDLGFFGRGAMQKPFEEAAFALEPGQMSGIVSTDSGFHLVYRIE